MPISVYLKLNIYSYVHIPKYLPHVVEIYLTPSPKSVPHLCYLSSWMKDTHTHNLYIFSKPETTQVSDTTLYVVRIYFPIDKPEVVITYYVASGLLLTPVGQPSGPFSLNS